MAKAARAKEEPLENIFEELHKLFLRYIPPFKAGSGTIRGKKDFHLLVPKAVAIPGAYGGKPTQIAMASLILQKSYVGFYFTCMYLNAEMKKKLSPALLKLLKGKTCFYVNKLDEGLRGDIKAALDVGTKSFKEKGWV
jgi:hypothetical protein